MELNKQANYVGRRKKILRGMVKISKTRLDKREREKKIFFTALVHGSSEVFLVLKLYSHLTLG